MCLMLTRVHKTAHVILPLTSAVEEEGPLACGTEVVIVGLSKLPAFNGLRGTVQSFDETTLRFSILLIEPAGGHKWVKVKRENVMPVAPLPPPLSPSAYASPFGTGAKSDFATTTFFLYSQQLSKR